MYLEMYNSIHLASVASGALTPDEAMLEYGMDIQEVLPLLLPKAIAWAEEQSALIRDNGEPLNETDNKLAETMGVRHAELVRILEVPSLPLPSDPELRQAALSVGLLGPTMVGLTLGYGVYVVQGHRNSRLLSHELRHVFHYERAGSIADFLPDYLQQLVSYGYFEAPLEIDARRHEQP